MKLGDQYFISGPFERSIEETWHGIDFIRLALWAFQDQMVGHAVKVLMKKEEAGFWHRYKEHEVDCRQFCKERGYDVDVDIAALVPKLRHVRNKAHFHLDRIGVQDPKASGRKQTLRGVGSKESW